MIPSVRPLTFYVKVLHEVFFALSYIFETLPLLLYDYRIVDKILLLLLLPKQVQVTDLEISVMFMSKFALDDS